LTVKVYTIFYKTVYEFIHIYMSQRIYLNYVVYKYQHPTFYGLDCTKLSQSGQRV